VAVTIIIVTKAGVEMALLSGSLANQPFSSTRTEGTVACLCRLCSYNNGEQSYAITVVETRRTMAALLRNFEQPARRVLYKYPPPPHF
jgi:hypothetical protein